MQPFQNMAPSSDASNPVGMPLAPFDFAASISGVLSAIPSSAPAAPVAAVATASASTAGGSRKRASDQIQTIDDQLLRIISRRRFDENNSGRGGGGGGGMVGDSSKATTGKPPSQISKNEAGPCQVVPTPQMPPSMNCTAWTPVSAVLHSSSAKTGNGDGHQQLLNGMNQLGSPYSFLQRPSTAVNFLLPVMDLNLFKTTASTEERMPSMLEPTTTTRKFQDSIAALMMLNNIGGGGAAAAAAAAAFAVGVGGGDTTCSSSSLLTELEVCIRQEELKLALDKLHTQRLSELLRQQQLQQQSQQQWQQKGGNNSTAASPIVTSYFGV
jgi:hypothetical protein